MARPTPCIGCGVQLGEDSELTLKYADPFDCTTENGLILKTNDTLQVVGGELGVVPSVYPTLYDEESWTGASVTSAFIDTGVITPSTTIRFGSGTLDKTISVTNTTDETYVVTGHWQIAPFISVASEAVSYSCFFDTAYDHDGDLGVATSRYDGLVYARFGSGDVFEHDVACAGSLSWQLAPGEYLNWGGSRAYRVDVTGNTVNTIGFRFARFRLVGTPLS